jgi:hypothetical protein
VKADTVEHWTHRVRVTCHTAPGRERSGSAAEQEEGAMRTSRPRWRGREEQLAGAWSARPVARRSSYLKRAARLG